LKSLGVISILKIEYIQLDKKIFNFVKLKFCKFKRTLILIVIALQIEKMAEWVKQRDVILKALKKARQEKETAWLKRQQAQKKVCEMVLTVQSRGESLIGDPLDFQVICQERDQADDVYNSASSAERRADEAWDRWESENGHLYELLISLQGE